MALAKSILMYGDRADQPTAGPENDGCYFRVQDEGDIVEQSDGSAWTALSVVSVGTSGVVQVVNTQTGAVASGSTVMPADDTIPQNTEGDQYMTLAITPTNASNKLRIDVVAHVACDTSSRNIAVALFQDSTANALAVTDSPVLGGGANFMRSVNFTHYMTAGTTSATTFKVRAGVETSGTVTFNGAGASRFYGGVFASSITITEIVP